MANANLYGSGQNSDDMARLALSERDKVEKAKEQPKPQRKLVSQYRREIERYDRATSNWRDEGKQIEDLYLDEDRKSTSVRRFALLWSNVETLKPAIYARVPTIECSRRYKDRDPTARIAAELMERATNTSFELYGADETFQMVRDDRLLAGRGTAWVRYEADIEQYHDDDEDEDAPAAEMPLPGLPGGPALDEAADEGEPTLREKLAGERVVCDYVQWTEFGHNVAGSWNDVWLVWRCVYKTRDEVEDRFGKEMANRLAYNAKVPSSVSDRVNGETVGENADEFCKILEVWDKRRRLTSWLTDSLPDEFIESGPPPINFSDFFPCPKPCYATKTSRSLIPRPDYVYYRDQAKEINDLTDKIGTMTEWLVIKGFVPAAPSRVADAIEETIRDKGNRELFTQVESWTEWTEKGGIAKLIDWMPVDMIIRTLQAAIQARTQLIQDVFQITGISDILRGQTDPGETLGAQELKAQTGSRRLKNAKDDLARFCRDVGRLCAEVIAEKFEPETIAAMTGYRYQPPAPPMTNVIPMTGAQMQQPVMVGGSGTTPPLAPDAMGDPRPGAAAAANDPQNGQTMVFDDRVMKLLHDDRLRSFRVDVETDSTGQADENADKQNAMEFMEAAGGFMDRAVSAIQNVPETAPLMGEMLTFAVRRFRAGRTLEEQIEQTFMGLAQKAMQAAQQGPQPSAEQIKAKADADAQAQKMAMDKQKHDQDMAAEQQKTEAALAIANAQLAKIHAETEYAQTEHLTRMAEIERTAALKTQEFGQKSDERAHNQQIRAAEHARDMAKPSAQPAQVM